MGCSCRELSENDLNTLGLSSLMEMRQKREKALWSIASYHNSALAFNNTQTVWERGNAKPPDWLELATVGEPVLDSARLSWLHLCVCVCVLGRGGLVEMSGRLLRCGEQKERGEKRARHLVCSEAPWQNSPISSMPAAPAQGHNEARNQAGFSQQKACSHQTHAHTGSQIHAYALIPELLIQQLDPLWWISVHMPTHAHISMIYKHR